MGREGRLRVALERETPLYRSPQARAPHFHPIENAAANFSGQANGIRSGSALSYTSQRVFAGAEIVTDLNLLPIKPDDYQVARNVICTISAGAFTLSGNQFPTPLETIRFDPCR
jgi:hypothetical protein